MQDDYLRENSTKIHPTLRQKLSGLVFARGNTRPGNRRHCHHPEYSGAVELHQWRPGPGYSQQALHPHPATDRFAEDNYSTLLAAAPQELDISVLEPYIGENIGQDAFGNTYKLTTRTYQITIPDPTNPIPGSTKQENALQVLVVGGYTNAAETALTEKITLRAEIANTAGASAGFIALDQVNCPDGAGGVRPDGGICGAFGSYSIDSSEFSATNFNNAAVVSLITKGDSSVYGDQLYRYDYGDPELNTMHTAILMNNNDIVDPSEITGVDRITMDGGPRSRSGTHRIN